MDLHSFAKATSTWSRGVIVQTYWVLPGKSLFNKLKFKDWILEELLEFIKSSHCYNCGRMIIPKLKLSNLSKNLAGGVGF